MPIYKRGKFWYVDVYVDGKRIKKSAGSKKKDAEILLGNIKESGINPHSTKIEIDKFFHRYIQYCDDNKTSETARIDKGRLRAWLKYFKENRIDYLHQIVPLIVENFKSRLLQKDSITTCNRYIELLKSTLNKAVEWELLKENKIAKFKITKPRTARQIRFFTKEEIQAILKEADEGMKKVIKILLYTGIRSGELVNLTWEDIDLKNRLIHIQSKEKFTPKSKRPRSIPINTKLLEVLQTIPQMGLYVFDNGNDQPAHSGQIYYDRFISILRKLGIKGRLHDLRHTFASHLAMNGVSLKAIQNLLGHHSITMTEIYAHLSPGYLHEAIKVLDF